MNRQQYMTLSALQEQIRQSVEEQLPLPVWVVAEISELKVNSSGHCYLELIEKGSRGRSVTAVASARAIIWRQDYALLSAYFRSTTGEALRSGMKILCRVMVTYHALYGLSLRITELDASYTIGETERERQQTISQLKADGVWDMNRTLELPSVLQRIAVVASGSSAGYRDFCSELLSSGYHFRVTLFEAVVQGEQAESAIVDSLSQIAEREDEFDVVVLIRGGGSVSDLRCFDSYLLSSVVAQFPLAIVTGIGHDKDTSVVDMVAHTPLKTPTAVATFLCQQMDLVMEKLGEYMLRLKELVGGYIAQMRLRLVAQREQLCRYGAQVLSSRHSVLELRCEQLQSLSRMSLERRRLRLLSAEELLMARSPERVLGMGFAIVRRDGNAVGQLSVLNAGDLVEVCLRDGSFEARIESIKTK